MWIIANIWFHPSYIFKNSITNSFSLKLIDNSMWRITNHFCFFFQTGADKLRIAERQAKEKKLRLWKDYQSNAQSFTGKEKDFTGVVVEVYNGDALSVKSPTGAIKKVFLSSIRPPREAGRYIHLLLIFNTISSIQILNILLLLYVLFCNPEPPMKMVSFHQDRRTSAHCTIFHTCMSVVSCCARSALPRKCSAFWITFHLPAIISQRNTATQSLLADRKCHTLLSILLIDSTGHE